MLFNLKEFLKSDIHNVRIGVGYTIFISKITGGTIVDADLLLAKHTNETKEEIVNDINANRNGYKVYYSGAGGKDSLIISDLTTPDFSKIKKVEMNFGDEGLRDKKVPYIPEGIFNLCLTYSFKGITVGGNYNIVGAQFTDYMNLDNVTGEGGIGKLASFKTIDLNLSYEFKSEKYRLLNGLNIFIAAKNLTDEVYVASRLHRVSSGIMPAGFRQVNGGIKLNL
jgi:outer membrane receptor protein involved in Fe transport